MNLKELVSVVESWEENAQKVLWGMLRELLREAGEPVEACERPDKAVAAGILVPEGETYAVSAEARPEIKRLYTYLERKFGVTLYFDPDKGGAVEIPSGAGFAPVMMIMGADCSMPLCFPEDEITQLLNQYGANRCGNWYMNG